MSGQDKIDVVFSHLGYGRWQVPMLVFAVAIQALVPVYLIGSTLLSAPMPFSCFFSQPDNTTYSLIRETTNTTITTTEMTTLAEYDSQCGVAAVRNSSHHHLQPQQQQHGPALYLRPTALPSCPLVEYDTSVFPETVISEFDLICERSALRPVYQMIYSAGAMVGSPLGGLVSDRYGRKRALQVVSLLNLASVLLMALSPWYAGVLVARFLLGASGNSAIGTAFNLAQETTPLKYRSVTGMLLGLGFSVDVVILAGLGYWLRPWRQLLLAGSLPILLLLLPLSMYTHPH